MSNVIEVEPTTAASTNPQNITFGTTAEVEVIVMPGQLINKEISGLELVKVDEYGIYLEKATLKAFLPWSIIVALQY